MLLSWACAAVFGWRVKGFAGARAYKPQLVTGEEGRRLHLFDRSMHSTSDDRASLPARYGVTASVGFGIIYG